MPTKEDVRHSLLPILIFLLIAVWLGGGVTDDETSINEWLQLLALPLVVVASAVLLGEVPRSCYYRRWGLAATLLITAVPLLQLLPLPVAWWSITPARTALSGDLMQAGVIGLQHRWSLAPVATENALWSLMPALAAFFAAMALQANHRRRLIQAVVLLVLINVLFAFFQAGLPPESALRLYSEFHHGFGGLLINTNHQATALIIGMALAVGLAVDSRDHAARGETRAHQHWWYAGLAICFLLLVPLSTSRAGMAIALLALAAALLLTGVVPLWQIGRSKRASVGTGVLAAVAIIGLRTAMGWMAVDQAEELRHVLSSATVGIGKTEAPLGSGVGSFIPVFEQAAPAKLWLASYVNHAHNEYAQWWLTTGWLGMLVLAFALALLLACGWRIVRLHGRGSHAIFSASCFVAICAVLAHSWVDYPLRTTTLMATTAALAGLMLASLDDARKRQKSRKRKQSGGEGDVQLA